MSVRGKQQKRVSEEEAQRPKEWRDRIVEGVAKTHAERIAWQQQMEEENGPLELSWKCPTCGVMKPKREFRMRQYRTMSGLVTEQRRGECKMCERKRDEERKKKAREENPEEYYRKRRAYNRVADAKRRNRKRPEGVMRNEKGQRVTGDGLMVKSGPLLEWVAGKYGEDWGAGTSGGDEAGSERSLFSEDARRRLHDAAKNGWINVGAADRILCEVGRGEMLYVLYGDDPGVSVHQRDRGDGVGRAA